MDVSPHQLIDILLSVNHPVLIFKSRRALRLRCAEQEAARPAAGSPGVEPRARIASSRKPRAWRPRSLLARQGNTETLAHGHEHTKYLLRGPV
jgi:hypothetical protein